MKKLLLVIAAFMTLTVTSCGKDSDDNSVKPITSLVGTSWRCMIGSELHWYNPNANFTVKFVSENEFELYYSSERGVLGEQRGTGTYTFTASDGHIDFNNHAVSFESGGVLVIEDGKLELVVDEYEIRLDVTYKGNPYWLHLYK